MPTRQNLKRMPPPRKRISSRFDDKGFQARFLQYISEGSSFSESCSMEKTYPSSVGAYIAQNKDFSEELEAAKTRGKCGLKAAIIKNGDWRAKAWALANIYKDEFSKASLTDQARMEVAVDLKVTLVKVLENLNLLQHADAICRQLDKTMFPSRVVDVEVDFTIDDTLEERDSKIGNPL